MSKQLFVRIRDIDNTKSWNIIHSNATGRDANTTRLEPLPAIHNLVDIKCIAHPNTIVRTETVVLGWHPWSTIMDEITSSKDI